MLDHASPLVRLLGQRDAIHHDASLLERELAVFRSQRQRKPAHQRPHYSPAERAQILEVMRLRGWSTKEAGSRFVVHPNTIRNWQRAVDDKLRAERLLGGPPWNRLHDTIRRLVHEIREAFPEPEFGTRTIARHLLRAGIGISRTTIRRVLQEEPPKPAKRAPQPRVTTAPNHVRHPTRPNRVWHLDLTEIRVLWKKVEIAAIIDGFSRKIVALKAFPKRPTSTDLAGLVVASIDSNGAAPRFLITDHGSQFRSRFRRSVEALGVTHIRCQVHTWQLNAKVERVFKDVKGWARRSLLPQSAKALQVRLDAYREWHNRFRPHAAHGTLTPVEAEHDVPVPETAIYRQEGGVEPRVQLHRRCVRGDPRLAYPVIRVSECRSEAA
ncbi:MAG: DDE-type integrase/transposase/recombinase [Phycisphaeraceae bacterium]|nr:DDE-type integrase/transposase/recombinase [Phycisphaeraceae bacterium]